MPSDNRTLTVTIVGNAAGAVTALGKTGAAVEDVGSKSTKTGTKIRASLNGAFASLSATGALGPLTEIFGKLNEATDAAAQKHKALGARMLEVGGITTGLGVALAAEGSADQSAQQQLAQAITDTGGSFSDYKDEIEKTVGSMAKYGHGAVDTQNALQALTQATNDPKKAIDEMGLAANLAAAKHESLTEASEQLAKVLNGKGTRTLASFGISMKDANGKTKDMQEVLAELSAKLNGQASAASDTFSGKIKGIQTELSNTVASLGQEFGPALTAIGPIMAGVGAVMESGVITKAKEAALAFVGFGLEEGEVSGITKIWTGIQAAFNVVMDANPVILVTVAIAALAAGAVYAYTHFKTFRTVVDDIATFLRTVFTASIHGVVTAVSAVIDWVTEHWPLLLGILTGPLGLAVSEIVTHWDAVKAFVETLPAKFAAVGAKLWDWIGALFHDEWEGVKTMWSTAVSFVAGLGFRITSASAGMWDGIKDAFRGAINFIIDGWNSLQFSLPSIDTHIPGVGKVGGGSFGVPQIPRLAAGGVVTSPTVALVGEAGPEAVVPLSKFGSLGGSGGVTVNVTVQGHVTTEKDLANSIALVVRDAITRDNKRNGKAWA
ncbi:hypothetical protein acdb102_31280 [Acidothermaceae bacterium B102]|nr:hypothetical protein acdb102_31280 [Acidothermaceae bacterium B102]